MLKLVILLSGRGSNFISIERAINEQALNAQISLVISDNADAAGIDYARSCGIKTTIIDASAFTSKKEFSQALLDTVKKTNATWAILAGYMRLIDKAFINHFSGRVLNIHPSLLPKHKGLNTHQRALDAGDTEHGASVHLVTPALDDGPVIIQTRVTILPDDNAETLAKRVLQKEHFIYPQTIAWLSNGTLDYKNGKLYYENQLLKQPFIWENIQRQKK